SSSARSWSCITPPILIGAAPGTENSAGAWSVPESPMRGQRCAPYGVAGSFVLEYTAWGATFGITGRPCDSHGSALGDTARFAASTLPVHDVRALATLSVSVSEMPSAS